MVRNIENGYREYTIRGNVVRYYKMQRIGSYTDAYFIGYMSAGGSYQLGKKANGTCYPRMGLTSTDEYIVKMFRDLYCPTVSYKNRGKRSSQKVKSNRDSFEIWFPRPMSTGFNKFGIFSYKQDRHMVGISKEFQWAYILGVVDAGGCFVVHNRRDCRTPRLKAYISSSAYYVLIEIQRRLEEAAIISSVYKRKGEDCYELRINSTEHSIKFGLLLYSSLPSVYNYKKKSIFDSYLQNYSSKSCTNSDELLESLPHDVDALISSQAYCTQHEGSETTGAVKSA